MAHRGGPGWPGRGPRLYRPDNGSNYGPFPGRGGNRAAGGGGGPRGFRGGPPMPILRPRHPPPPPSTTTPLSPPHPPVVNYRQRGDELSAGGSDREGIVHREQYDYGHGRDRSRSPFAKRESQYATKQHCDINALLRDESMKITVGNDKFKDPQQTGSGVHSSSASQNAVLPTSRTLPQEYAEETASVARAKEMAMRTREMLSKLTGWTPISLQPASAESSAKTGGRPNVVNVSNSAYTKLSASSEVAKTILRNMNAVAAAFCPKESGGVAHIRYTGAVGSEKAAKEDEDRFLYGEDLVPKNLEKPLVESGVLKSALRKQVMSSGVETPVRNSEMGSNCDPVVADVLKSIGFNFELSKIMQEKAKKEREENDRNRLLIQQASSFLAKQLARTNAPDASAGAKSFENLRIVVNKDAGPGEILLDRPKERKKQVLYDDFSNSEDEFCESERNINIAASSNNSITQPQTASVVGSLPSNLTFPSSVPFSAALLPTPPVAFPLSSAVPPPQITVPPHQILLPPQVLSHQTMPQQPVWPGYQMLGANSSSKMRTGSHLSDEVEWEQNTEDFLRKLQEPRANDAPPKPGTKVQSRPSLQGSSDSERQRRMASRRRKRDTSESPEPMKRQRKFGRKDSKNRFEDDGDGHWDSNDLRRLASLREKLHSIKKEHSRLMCIRQKSTYVKEKLVSTARLQCKLMDEIEELERLERRGDRHEAAASGEESLPDLDRKKTDSNRPSQTRSLNRKSREKSKERDQKASGSKGAGPDQRLSKTKATRRSADEQQKPSAGVEPEKTVQNSGSEVKSETSSCSKSEIAVPAKEVIASQGTETGLKTNADKNTELKDPEDPSEKLEMQKSKKVKLRYDYYDGGDNRCSVCTRTFSKLVDFLQHLHSEAHEKKVDNRKAVVGKPWTLNRSLQPKPHNSVPPISVPASGMEFMKPIRGFFCSLCSQFSGDCEDAELHVLSEEHNEKFKKHCLANPAHLNEFGVIKAETLKTEKCDNSETAGDVNDDNDNSNFLSETSKDDFESKAIMKANQLAAKYTSIPASASDSAAIEKFPRLGNEKEWNSEEKVGGSREVKDEPKSMLDSGDGGSSSEVLKLRSFKMEACSDEEEGFGDPGKMQVSPPGAGTLTAESSKNMDVGFPNGGTCSLVPYEDAEDNDFDWGTPSIAERVSVEHLPEKSEIDNEECVNVCDVVDQISENDTGLVLSVVCPPESDTIVSDERVESPICPLEGSLSSREKQKKATGFCISGEMSVTEAAESSDSEPREILLGESVGDYESMEPMVFERDESYLPVVSTFSVQSEAVKHLLEEDSNTCQLLESPVVEAGDKGLLTAEQPYIEQFEAVDLSFDDALEGFNFMKTSEGSLTSASGTVVNSEVVESCATEAFYGHGPMELSAVRSFTDVRPLEADVQCLEASAVEASKGIVEICDVAAESVDGKNITPCQSYLADVTCATKGTDGIRSECTDDYIILLDEDDDDDDVLDTLLETCAEVVPVDEGKCQDETQHRIMGEDEAGNDY